MRTEAEIQDKIAQLTEAGKASEQAAAHCYPQVIALYWVLEDQEALRQILGEAEPEPDNEVVTPDELDMLRSYADGPRIWDAASLVPTVTALVDKKLIRACHRWAGDKACELTDLGREVLAHA